MLGPARRLGCQSTDLPESQVQGAEGALGYRVRTKWYAIALQLRQAVDAQLIVHERKTLDRLLYRQSDRRGDRSDEDDQQADGRQQCAQPPTATTRSTDAQEDSVEDARQDGGQEQRHAERPHHIAREKESKHE